jgi:hypothetical protein
MKSLWLSPLWAKRCSTNGYKPILPFPNPIVHSGDLHWDNAVPVLLQQQETLPFEHKLHYNAQSKITISNKYSPGFLVNVEVFFINMDDVLQRLLCFLCITFECLRIF